MLTLHSCQPKQAKVLVFSKTAAFRHSCIQTGIAALQKLSEGNDILMTSTEDATVFTPENLNQYAAIVFYNTTGNVLNPAQQTAMEQYIQKGGGFVGIHSAADTEYEWEWYNKLVGAYFVNHPAVQPADIMVQNSAHLSTQMLPKVWKRTDEWYNYKSIYDQINILLTVDEASYEGGTNGNPHPIAWYHEFDGGRAFYTGLGHTEECYKEELFLQHLLGGIQYAIGEKQP